MTAAYPETAAGSSNKYQNWELVDPEKWVPDGYAIVRIDSRGAGRSPGLSRSVVAARDKRPLRLRGMGGNPALVERQGRPQRHLLLRHEPVARGAAAAAASRRAVHLGRLVRLLPRARAPRRHPLRLSAQLVAPASASVQHGVGERGPKSQVTGEWVAGPPTLSEQELAGNRADCRRRSSAAPADRRLLPRAHAGLRRIEVPLLSAANWGGHGLHPRGNFEGYLAAGSQAEVAGGARRHALLALLHQLWHRVAKALLRPLPQGREHRLGAAAEGRAQHPAAGREVQAARRE